MTGPCPADCPARQAPRDLGRATAGLHAALATPTTVIPHPVGTADRRPWAPGWTMPRRARHRTSTVPPAIAWSFASDRQVSASASDAWPAGRRRRPAHPRRPARGPGAQLTARPGHHRPGRRHLGRPGGARAATAHRPGRGPDDLQPRPRGPTGGPADGWSPQRRHRGLDRHRPDRLPRRVPDGTRVSGQRGSPR